MIIYGKNPVFEAIKCGLVHAVYIRKGTALYDVTFDVPVKILGKEEFDHRFSREAQGLAAEIDDFKPIYLDEAGGLDSAKGVVILDRIQDPHNYGAIIRSAHCFGINHIIVPRYHQAPMTASVCKASAGAIFYTTIIEETNLSKVCTVLKTKGFSIAACDADAQMPVSQAPKEKIAVIVGSEGRGIRDCILQNVDLSLRIPMSGQLDSLNAAQSAAIVFYELFSR
ncbi:MAG: RNA methyltransferase [Deferribacteraceae bacterium]|jgi:23S rRNA (guanosine2251-2'-O)-methyltransferase|nr:RNA methyltransferase [Deferribacteraceae bacterium]